MADSRRILIVDDEPRVAFFLQESLESLERNYQVVHAETGESALEAMDRGRFDVVITDLRMPGMNGLELYRESRKAYPRLITIFMTAYAADELIQQGMAEGIKTVLTKPVEIDFMVHLFSAYQRVITEAG